MLAERANNELCAWGHAEHQVALERVIPFFGDPRILRWDFWWETCRVIQLARLSEPVGVKRCDLCRPISRMNPGHL